jgi:galactose-1-phosphate uridylyltransferase
MSHSKAATHQAAAGQHAHDHPDATYIKRDDIGVVVAKGLAVLFKTQPSNPVDFLAKWLLNYSQVEKTALNEKEHLEQVKELKDKLDYQTSVDKKRQEEKLHEEEEVNLRIKEFYAKIELSTDLNDQLQDLAVFLKEFSKATAVYIGKLVSPKRPIKDDDDDNAHRDEDS